MIVQTKAPYSSKRLLRVASSPHFLALLTFVLFYLAAVDIFRRTSVRDPGSAFFKPALGFDRIYSAFRQDQADTFVASVDPSGQGVVHAGESPSICVGIASVQREGARYLKSAIGSLLHGLSDEQRRDLHLTLFLAHIDPAVHMDHNETWSLVLPDERLTYDSLSPEAVNYLRELETSKTYTEKPLFDYVHLLKSCYARHTPWIMMLEDDVLAMDGWYNPTMQALAELESRSDFNTSAYLRLFYTEQFFGWNSEEWPYYLFWSVCLAGAAIAAIYMTRKYYRPSTHFLTLPTNLSIIFICLPMVIGLYFAAGRMTVSPLPHGLQPMDKFGCCSQAFVFPRHAIPGLVEYYEMRHDGYIDMITETYSDDNRLARWALVPSVFQHVGLKSSKGDDMAHANWGRAAAANIWNYEFELKRPVGIEQDV